MYCILKFALFLGTSAYGASDKPIADQKDNIRKETANENADISVPQAIEMENRYNRQLFDQIHQLNKNITASENKMADLETALQAEKDLNGRLQGQVQQLTALVKAANDKYIDMDIILERERLLHQQCISRLQAMEGKNTDSNLKNKKLIAILTPIEISTLINNMVTTFVRKETTSLSAKVTTTVKPKENNTVRPNKTSTVRPNPASIVRLNEASTVRPTKTTNLRRKENTNRLSIIPNISHNSEEWEMTTTVRVVTSCQGIQSSGVYEMFFASVDKIKYVYCDAVTDGGDWIVTMRRQDGSVKFNKRWNKYKNGFGNPVGEFWIGNDLLHELTKFGPRELRIDMEDFDGDKRFAKYERFQVGSEEDKYILSVSGYSGTAGDSLVDTKPYWIHDGMKFTTRDSDNDGWKRNCACKFRGGWWFNRCGISLLTGPYSQTSDINWYRGVIWEIWTGTYKSLKFVEMKVR